MKRIICFLTLIICFCMTPIQAQKKMMSQEEFRKQQQMFLTERAGLTPEEAKNFFPLYFELQDKKRSYNKEAWQKLRKGKEAGTTEAEYDRIIEDVLQTRITIDQLELEYARKYKQFLSAKKIYQIQKAEMKFHRELLKKKADGEVYLYLSVSVIQLPAPTTLQASTPSYSLHTEGFSGIPL